jgi:hypothetical protein
MIKIGSRWQTVDKKFIVIDVIEKSEDSWVYYKNVQTLQEYNCRAEAFLARFSEIANEN